MSGTAPGETGQGAAAVVAAAPARPARWRRWLVATGLGAIVLVFGIADGFPMFALPLGVLLLGLSTRQRWWWLGIAALVWGFALLPAGGAFHMMSRGWALLIGGAFLTVTLLRPRWGVFSRSLASVGAAFAAAAAVLLAVDGWARFDEAMARHFDSLAMLTSREMLARFPDAAWASEMAGVTARMASLQGTLFPSLLALQSLAALALAWWAFTRSRSRAATRLGLRPFREFRFNDSLVWVAIAGLVLVLYPLGEVAVRAGYNLLTFMGALYVLRGVAVFVFLARGGPSMISVALGLVATVLFYPIVFTAALLVGLGDTWLDVRGRVESAAVRA
jgi:hypothetical protein